MKITVTLRTGKTLNFPGVNIIQFKDDMLGGILAFEDDDNVEQIAMRHIADMYIAKESNADTPD